VSETQRQQPRQHEPATYSLWQMTLYALKLGAIGFGGPVALVGYMQRDLVEQRGWLTQDDYDEGLALAQLSPGPLAAQLAIYLGYCHYGIPGASLVGVAFVLPSFLIVLAFSVAYVAVGGSPLVGAIFYTVGAAIIGIIAHSAQKLTRKIVGRDRLLWAIWATLAVTTLLSERESITLIVLAGALAWLVKAPPAVLRRLAVRRGAASLLPVGLLASGAPAALATTAAPASGELLVDIALFFGKAGAFVFGSGLAIVPFLFGGVVQQLQWLSEQQFLDAVAVALITPGPVVITTAFIGYLVAGFAGATVAAFATFFPCYLLTVLPAPYMRRYGQLPSINAAVQGVTAAAVGAIAGAVVVLGRRSVFDLTTVLIAVATYLLLWKGVAGRRVPEPLVVLVAAAVGLAIFPLRT
jgi:chromate transporter